MFVGDTEECYGIEGVSETYFVEEVKPEGAVKTNHFFHVRSQDLDCKIDEFARDWTRAHYRRASELLKSVDSVEDMQDVLRDRKDAICTNDEEGKCYTHSAFVFDTNHKCVWYAQGNPLEVEFKRYGFEV